MGLMRLQYQKSTGFTLVELVIVIAVIGILATLAILGFSNIQSDTRDQERNSSVTILSEALEKYYDTHGEYPSCTVMTGSAAAVRTALGVDTDVLKAPNNSTANSVVCTDITASTTNDVYAYVGDGSAACNTGAACPLYTLKYKDEATGEIKSLKSKRTAVASSTALGTPVLLTASPQADYYVNGVLVRGTLKKRDLTWSAASNAINYYVQASTSSSFPTTSATTSMAFTGTSGTYEGLVASTTYYFRIQAVAFNGTTSPWSNTITVTTADYDLY